MSSEPKASSENSWIVLPEISVGWIPAAEVILYYDGMIDESAIRLRFSALDPVLDERGRRRFAAAEALSAGRGGIAAVSRATGLARSTIGRALNELRGGEPVDATRVRRAGGGRKPASETDVSLLEDLRSLLEPATRGDPQSPLLWTCKSLRKLDYSLQSNRKTREGSNHPDRDAQLHYINDRVKKALAAGEPATSVDTKKKELVGDFRTPGASGGRKGRPRRSAFMTSSSLNLGALCLTASMTSPPTPAGSAWASTTIRRLSRPTPSAPGGGSWGVNAIQTPAVC